MPMPGQPACKCHGTMGDGESPVHDTNRPSSSPALASGVSPLETSRVMRGEEQEAAGGEGIATDREGKRGSFLTLRGMLSGSRCAEIKPGDRWRSHRSRLISDQASFPSSRAPGCSARADPPLVLASRSHGNLLSGGTAASWLTFLAGQE
ncbi:hypothetical protein PVAP13_1NG374100 [Panicum virgatum]|uniref:Uncharacterized protein n=1 Tax=Panicum virgatum TaxID=38727 RepID=A0A8T0WZR9_PANVG|nr:hypothetical protein PVAP13_1NG374100 [Panicum virgatum]